MTLTHIASRALGTPLLIERGTDLHTQSNPLPMCHRPGVLVKLTTS